MPKKLLCGVLSMALVLSFISMSCEIANSNNHSNNGVSTILENIAMAVNMMAMPDGLNVKIKPINAKANKLYYVELDEKGNFRDQKNVVWSEPQINVGDIQTLIFKLKDDEFEPYMRANMKDYEWWKSIFSIKIQESNIVRATSTTTSTSGNASAISLIYPKGGEQTLF